MVKSDIGMQVREVPIRGRLALKTTLLPSTKTLSCIHKFGENCHRQMVEIQPWRGSEVLQRYGYETVVRLGLCTRRWAIYASGGKKILDDAWMCIMLK